MKQHFLKIKVSDSKDTAEQVNALKAQYPDLPNFVLNIEDGDKEKGWLTLVLTDGESMDVHVRYKDSEYFTKKDALINILRVRELNTHAKLISVFTGFTYDDFTTKYTTVQIQFRFI